MPGFTRVGLLVVFTSLCGFIGCQRAVVSDEVSSNSLAQRTPEDVLELEILLTRAAHAGDDEAVRALLEQGADPDGLSGTKMRRYMQAVGRPGKRHGIRAYASPLIAAFARPWDEEKREYKPVDESKVLAVAELLLQAGADPDIQGGMGVLALEEAVGFGFVEGVRLLIESGADVNLSAAGFTQIDIHRGDAPTPLAQAIQGGHHDIIALLLKAEADIYNDDWGMDALSRAAYEHDPVAMALILEATEKYGLGAKPLSLALGELINEWPRDDEANPAYVHRERADWLKCFTMLVERGATLTYTRDDVYRFLLEEIDLPIFRDWVAVGGRQGLNEKRIKPISLDDLYEDLDSTGLLQRLLADGVDPNTRVYRFDGEPYLAFFDIDYDLDEPDGVARLRLLVDAGFDLDVRGNDGGTVLHYAAEYGSPALVAYLIEKGSAINIEDAFANTPLDLANGEAIVKLLVERGAKRGQGNGIAEPSLENMPQAQAVTNAVVAKLENIDARQSAFDSIVGQQRYLRRIWFDKWRGHEPFTVGQVLRLDLPKGPAAYLVFDLEKNGQGRSRFVYVRGDGAMLPSRSGEQWRLRPADVIDLDQDGIKEMLIDVTLRDNATHLGGLRVISTLPGAGVDTDLGWMVLFPHWTEPGAWRWQVNDSSEQGKSRTISFGPLGGSGDLLWSPWELVYNPDWLSEQVSDYGLFADGTVLPLRLVRDDAAEHVAGDVAEDLAEQVYPERYR